MTASTIYLDHQASTPTDKAVLDAMQAVGFGNPHSNEHAIGWHASLAVTAARQSIARLIGSDEDEIIFTSGATEANNLATIGLRGFRHLGRRTILRGAIEHKSIIAACDYLADEYGFKIEVVPVDSDGRVLIDALDRALNGDVALCTIAAVNSEIGIIENLEAIAEVTRRHDVLFHTDAAQAAVAIDLSHITEYADMVSLSAHKMYGPMGIGALYVRRELQSRLKPLIHGGGQQNGLRSGTLPLGLCVGFGRAASMPDAQKMRQEVRRLRGLFLDGLIARGISFDLNGPSDSLRHPGNANIRFAGVDAQLLLGALQPYVSASSGSACTSGIQEPSHVLLAIGLSEEECSQSVRFSFGATNTEDDVHNALDRIQLALENQ